MKKRRIKKKFLVVFLIFSLFCIIPFVYSKYAKRYNRHLTINAVQPTYTVSFNANGGTGTMGTQSFTYKTSQSLNKNTFVKENSEFDSWNTSIDGTGTSYDDEEVVSNLTSVDGDTVVLYAQWAEQGKVARIGSVYYDSLQDAINDVPTDNTETNIVLLQNTNEAITINANKNIVFDLQNYTVGGSGTVPTIKNYGTIRISNGTITNYSTSTSALVDNYSTGTLYITGGNFISLGTKQGIYNEGGVTYISGNAYISSKATGVYDRVERATVQNRLSGSITITGGTIVNSVGSGVSLNTGNVVIGIKDGNVDNNQVVIQAKTYGIYNFTPFKFYDGKIAGITASIYNSGNINDVESGHFVKNTTEVIDTKTYKVATLDPACTVSFDPNGGSTSVTEKYVESGQPIGTLPLPIRKNYIFDGWFTDPDNGVQVDENTVVTSNLDLYAHWHQEEIAEMNGRRYYSLQAAISAATANVETTVTLLTDTTENITISANKNIVLNLQNYTVKQYSNSPVFTNNGKLKITNGTIKQTIAYAAVNNETTGELIMTGGTILSTGGRSGIYNIGSGKVTISGSAYISSNASGAYTLDSVAVDRGAVMNLNAQSIINITGGTIIGTASLGISNNGTLNLGTQGDGIIDTSSPVVMGKTYGIKNNYTFNFYDGIIKGKTDAITGTITNQEIYTQIINGTEVIDGVTYKTIHLQNTE